MILTDDRGVSYTIRDREEFPAGVNGWIAWTRAANAIRDRITSDANRAFDRAFRAELKKNKKKESQ